MARSVHPFDHLINLRLIAVALRREGYTQAADDYRAQADGVEKILLTSSQTN